MLTAPQNPAQNLGVLHEKIGAAARAAGRDPAGVTLLGVAKAQPLSRLQAAAAAGLRDFGENYLQEAREHRAALGGQPLSWHFIGALQGNKTRPVAEAFDWVHTLDRLRIAERLAAQRPAALPPLEVCIQVRLGDEPGRAGIPPAELPALAAAISGLPRLRLRGLMCLPPEEHEPARQRHWFRELRRLRDALNAAGHGLDVLSMGMSGDFEAAVAEGATHLRIGAALFGPRGEPAADGYNARHG
ncbi:MAG: YggS family pyridoxal phosphate-dependent enzyme [Gammaproteobacteria bacterium]|nr:MAG: YggS family pyridoxal phosphate-dependent enzyme [Gammaproteobacteria bacterium]